MGYELHITRRDEWSEIGNAIELDEWLQVVHGDPELRLDGAARATTPSDETIRVTSRGLAVWVAYSGDEWAWIDHRAGCVVVKNPDDEIIRKMFQIAELLGARVQGDEGELYGPDGQPINDVVRPDRATTPGRPATGPRRWLRFRRSGTS